MLRRAIRFSAGSVARVGPSDGERSPKDGQSLLEAIDRDLREEGVERGHDRPAPDQGHRVDLEEPGEERRRRRPARVGSRGADRPRARARRRRSPGEVEQTGGEAGRPGVHGVAVHWPARGRDPGGPVDAAWVMRDLVQDPRAPHRSGATASSSPVAASGTRSTARMNSLAEQRQDRGVAQRTSARATCRSARPDSARAARASDGRSSSSAARRSQASSAWPAGRGAARDDRLEQRRRPPAPVVVRRRQGAVERARPRPPRARRRGRSPRRARRRSPASTAPPSVSRAREQRRGRRPRRCGARAPARAALERGVRDAGDAQPMEEHAACATSTASLRGAMTRSGSSRRAGAGGRRARARTPPGSELRPIRAATRPTRVPDRRSATGTPSTGVGVATAERGDAPPRAPRRGRARSCRGCRERQREPIRLDGVGERRREAAQAQVLGERDAAPRAWRARSRRRRRARAGSSAARGCRRRSRAAPTSRGKLYGISVTRGRHRRGSASSSARSTSPATNAAACAAPTTTRSLRRRRRRRRCASSGAPSRVARRDAIGAVASRADEVGVGDQGARGSVGVVGGRLERRLPELLEASGSRAPAAHGLGQIVQRSPASAARRPSSSSAAGVAPRRVVRRAAASAMPDGRVDEARPARRGRARPGAARRTRASSRRTATATIRASPSVR